VHNSGRHSVEECWGISLPVTFGMPENYRMESIVFDVAEVDLPFNSIIGRLVLYKFMAVTQYGYLVLKMSSPNDIIKIHRDRYVGVSMMEKLQALAAAHEAAAGQGAPDQAPSSLRQCISSSTPYVQPSDSEDVPVKIIQIGADAAQTTRITGKLGDK
jgi:hypothetical protein